MLAWLRTPRGSTATATAVVAILLLAWLMPWSRPLLLRLPFASSGGTAPAETASPASQTPAGPAPQASLTAPPATPAAQPATAGATSSDAAKPASPAANPPPAAATADLAPLNAPAATNPAPAADATAGLPAFDIVRVQPAGDAVIAGRGEPGSSVSLMDGETALGTATIDATGQFALLPPALGVGSHYLTLRATKAGKPASTSAQGVAVTVAAGGATRPLVALLAPDAPTRILSDAVPAAAAKAAGQGAPAPVSMAIQAVEAQQGGRFTATGRAHAGNQCRIYLNGAFLADVRADKDGRWSVSVEKGMQPGRYVVRADELEASSGKVLNRAEVPFDYPAALVAGDRKPLAVRGNGAAGTVVAEATDPSALQPPATQQASAEPAARSDGTGPQPSATAVVSELNTAKVVRGDSLWRISRKMLGHGIKYTQIYASNAAQIRNPKLIYPGQVFVVPSAPSP